MAKGPGGGTPKPPKDPTIYGTVGNDIINISGNPDHGDMVDGLAGNDTIIGSNFQDMLYGNLGDDRIFGGGGDDWIEGGLGNDHMDGGAGFFDWVTFGRAANGVTVDLSITTAQNTGVGFDRILNFENLAGTAFNDTLRGNAGNNQIFGGTGNDFIDGGAGNDTIQDETGSDTFRGGAGNDTIMINDQLAENDVIDGGIGTDSLMFTASFRPTANPGVTVDLNILTAQNTGYGMDTITGIENVYGTNGGPDIITGNNLNNILDGQGGADVIKGMGGNDTINSNGTADGGAGNDTVFGLMQALGGTGNDTVTSYGLVGDGFADGGAGDDIVFGFGTALGGAGNDKVAGTTMTGGLGADWFSAAASNILGPIFTAGGLRESTVTDFSRAQLDKIDLAGFFSSLGITGFFVGNGPFTSFVGHAEARIVAGATVQNVEIDISGDRVADYVMHVNGTTPLIASDFIL